MTPLISQQLNEQLRDAMLAFYLHAFNPLHSHDPAAQHAPRASLDDLYGYWLLDVQVSQSVITSRVASAIGSLQQYINSIASGFEPGYDLLAITPSQRMRWETNLHSYSVWHAHQQLRYFPSNFLNPVLRLDKTESFQQLENDINQPNLQPDHIRSAVNRYLGRVEEVAQLQVINGYIDGSSKAMADSHYYLVGKSNGENTFYWRTLDMAKQSALPLTDAHPTLPASYSVPTAWTDWRKIPIPASFDIPVQSIRPVYFNDRLFVVWAQCTQPPVGHDGPSTSPANLDIFNPEHLRHFMKRYVRMRLHYAYLKIDGSWSCPHVCIDEYAIHKGLNELSGDALNATVTTVAVVDPHTSPASLYFGLTATAPGRSDATSTLTRSKFSFSHAVRLDNQLNVHHLQSTYSLTSELVIFPNNIAQQASRYLDIFAKHNQRRFGFKAPSINTVDIKIDNPTAHHPGTDRWDFQGTQKNIADAQAPVKATFNKTTSSLEITSAVDRHFPSFKSVELVVQQSEYWFFLKFTVLWTTRAGGAIIALDSDSYLNLHHPQPSRLLHDVLSLELTCNKTGTVFRDFIQHANKPLDSEGLIVKPFGQTLFSEMYNLKGFSLSTEVFDYLFQTPDTTYSAKLAVNAVSRSTDTAIDSRELLLEKVKLSRLERVYKQVIMTLDAHDKDQVVQYPVNIHISNTHLVGDSQVLRRNLEGGTPELIAGQTFSASLGLTAERLNDYISHAKKIPIIHGVLIREQNIDDMRFTILGYALKAYEITLNENNVADIPMAPFIDRQESYTRGIAEFINFSGSTIALSNGAVALPRAPIRLNTTLGDKLIPAASAGMDTLFALSHTHREPPLTGATGHQPLDFHGAVGKYHWELFLYLPWLIAHRLNLEQRYGEAEAWLNYLFDPSRKSKGASSASDYWGLSVLTAGHTEMSYVLDNPQDPNQIALSAPIHFRRALYALYVDILVNRGDAAYRQATPESLNEAKLWYVRAKSLLGAKPTLRLMDPWTSIGLDTFTTQTDDHLRVNERKALRPDSGLPLVSNHLRAAQRSHRANDSQYLCVPLNSTLLARWDKVEARLHNLRQHLDITGKPLRVSLYATPASPQHLLSLYASQRIPGDAVSARRQPAHAGHYKFQVMHALAMAAVDNVVQLGSTLLSIIERKAQAEQVELQQQQVWQMAGLSLEQQAQSLIIDEKNEAALQAGQEIVEGRIAHLERLIKDGVSPNEQQATQELQASAALESVAYGLQGAAGLAMLAPNIFGTSTGGWRLEGAFYAAQAGVQLLANEKRANATHLDRNEAFNRRTQEWEHTLAQSRLELAQVKAQLRVQREQANSSRLQYASAEMALRQARLMFDLLEKRFTTSQLYQWLNTQFSSFYLQAYDMALSLCLDAQACWHYERAESDRTFVHAAQWNSHRSGLSAGEGLKLSLINMQAAYFHNHARPMEITKTISLRQLKAKDPNATRNAAWEELSASLKKTGIVEFELTKALFDADYPEHYLRRIKSISVTLPATLSPYEDIRATLTQTHHTIHTPDKGEFEYSSHRINEQIALSTGLNDSGLFTLNFDGGDRYLPFEFTGAVSGWRLSFPNPSAQQAMLNSLTDIIIHVRYVAKSAGAQA